MNVALSELPRFSCLPERGPHHASGIILAPSLALHGPRLPRCARRRHRPRADRGNADPEHAGRLARAQGRARGEPFLPALRAGSRLGQPQDGSRSSASSTWSSRMRPASGSSVVAHSALSPADLEREFGLTGGDIFHGALSLDQLWSARPVLGHADYRTPVKGLYLCGSGAHPGGGVTGAPGHNCAREVLRDFGRRMPGLGCAA